MNEPAFDKQYRVLDQTLSMHASLRDCYKLRALVLNCFLLFAAVVLNACVFIDDATLTTLGLDAGRVTIAISLSSVAIFAISILELRVDWNGVAKGHESAVEKLSVLKFKYRESIDRAKAHCETEHLALATEYARTCADIPPIPEAVFNKLKRRHLLKKLVSEKIAQNPGVPIWMVKTKIHMHGIHKLAKD